MIPESFENVPPTEDSAFACAVVPFMIPNQGFTRFSNTRYIADRQQCTLTPKNYKC